MKLRTFALNELPSFGEHLAVIPDFLPQETFAALKDEINSLTTITRGNIPLHKQGGTISYETLRNYAPQAVALYQNPQYQELISAIIGTNIVPTPLHHPNSLSVLIYEKPGDRIGWHHDNNFYKGRYFTVLLPIENRGHGDDGLSSVRLLVRKKTGDIVIPTSPNRLVVFEGSKILHRATRLKEGERRVVLSMTFSTNPTYSLPKEIMRRMKDTAFFGLKALWS